jgi:hypothetical protein
MALTRARARGAAGFAAGFAAGMRGVPHFEQNLNVAAFALAHFGHCFCGPATAPIGIF